MAKHQLKAQPATLPEPPWRLVVLSRTERMNGTKPYLWRLGNGAAERVKVSPGRMRLTLHVKPGDYLEGRWSHVQERGPAWVKKRRGVAICAAGAFVIPLDLARRLAELRWPALGPFVVDDKDQCRDAMSGNLPVIHELDPPIRRRSGIVVMVPGDGPMAIGIENFAPPLCRLLPDSFAPDLGEPLTGWRFDL